MSLLTPGSLRKSAVTILITAKTTRVIYVRKSTAYHALTSSTMGLTTAGQLPEWVISNMVYSAFMKLPYKPRGEGISNKPTSKHSKMFMENHASSEKHGKTATLVNVLAFVLLPYYNEQPCLFKNISRWPTHQQQYRANWFGFWWFRSKTLEKTRF